MFKNRLSYFFLQKLILSSRSQSLIRRIAILSFVAITLSIAVFFIVLFVMNGMNRNIQRRILAIDPNITLYNTVQTAANSAQDFQFPQTETIPFESYDLILRTVDGQFKGAQVVGYSQPGLTFWNNQLQKLKDSEKNHAVYDYHQDLNLEKNEIAIGIDLARSLQLLEGDQVTLIPAETLLLSQLETPVYEKATVRKIISTELYDLDSKLVLFNSSTSFDSLKNGLSKVSGYHLWVNDSRRIDDLVQTIKNKNNSANHSAVRVETWKEKNSDLFFALMMEKTIIGVFLALAGLIASSSILTVLAMIMSQKKSDIAMLKTLGYSRKKTLWLMAKMGLWISVSGLFLGTVIGLAVSYYLQFYPLKVLPDVYYDSTLPALVDLEFTVWVILAVVVLAVVGCYFPARSTLKIEPAVLLRRQ